MAPAKISTMISVMPVGSLRSSNCHTPCVPSSQVAKVNSPANANHSSHSGSAAAADMGSGRTGKSVKEAGLMH